MPATFPPVRTDLFAFFILLGAVQGFLLCYFFIFNSRGGRFSNLLLGILLLGMSLIMLDVWLGYTNYMFQVLWIMDFTEPINLLLAPLTYLYIKTGINQRFNKKDLLHFLPAAIYFIYMCLLIYPQSIEFKYNNNIGSFHPELNNIPAYVYGKRWMFFPKRHIGDFTFISLICYNILGFIFLDKSYKKQNLSFFSTQKTSLSWYRKFLLELLMLVFVYVIVRQSFSRDLGDHIISAFLSAITYATSISVVRRSLFFQENNNKSPKKYEKSSLTTELQNTTLRKLEEVMTNEKPFLDPGFSLPLLAKRLGVSTHHLSQILNEELGQSFFDFLASYRITEAQKLLTSEENHFIKIEEIAQMVGYNSKSAFNTTFRKVTGFTPSEFKKQSVK